MTKKQGIRKTKFTVLCLAVLLLVGLTACSDAIENQDGPTQSTVTEQPDNETPNESAENGDPDFAGFPQWVLDGLPQEVLENLRAAVRMGEPFTIQVDSERRFSFPDDLVDATYNDATENQEDSTQTTFAEQPAAETSSENVGNQDTLTHTEVARQPPIESAEGQDVPAQTTFEEQPAIETPSGNIEDYDFAGFPQWVIDGLPQEVLENLREAVRSGVPFTIQVDSGRRFNFPDDLE